MRHFLIVPTLAAAVMLGGLSAGAALFQVSEDFSVDPPNWTGFRNVDGAFGTDFGFSNTSHAGGSPGEAGGRVPERTDSVIAYYADTSVAENRRLSDLDTLHASGKFTLTTDTIAPDGGFYIGWLTTTPSNTVDPRRIGINVNARDIGTGINYWWRPQARYESGGSLSSYNPPESNTWRDSPDGAIIPGELYDFEISYDGAGTLTVSISGLDTRSVTLPTGDPVFREGAAGLNAFGMFTNRSNRNEPNSLFFPFIDDLQYTSSIPEPASGSLALLGALVAGICCRRRGKDSQ